MAELMHPFVGTSFCRVFFLTPDSPAHVRPEHGEEVRVYACSCSFFLLAAFYFTCYFNFKPAPFHKLIYQNFQRLVAVSAKEAARIAYRDSAKTPIVKIALVWLIRRKQAISALRHNGKNVSARGNRLYIRHDPYDKANAQGILFDVVTELQANEFVIADFGHLYYQPRTRR